ncbi:MAG: hypothetical protein AB8F34_11010 [Akkermansiaceae bacterium]
MLVVLAAAGYEEWRRTAGSSIADHLPAKGWFFLFAVHTWALLWMIIRTSENSAKHLSGANDLTNDS